MQPIQFFAARAEDGALVPGAAVDVFVTGTQTRAALFADSLGSVPLGNPAQADNNARVFFYSAITRVDIRIHRGAYVGPLMRDVVITDPDDVLTLTNGLYRTIAQGLAATSNGQIFQVLSPEDEAAYAIYQNVGGTAFDTGKRVPARYLLDRVESASKQYAEAAAAYAGRNFGPLAADPSTNPLGEPLAAGDRYFNAAVGIERVYNGSVWYTPNADGQSIQIAFGDHDDPMKGGAFVGRAIRTLKSVRLFSGGNGELKSVVGRYEGETVQVHGFWDTKPGVGGGLFRWSAASTATEDGGTVFSVTGFFTGRWVRQFRGDSIDPLWFGALGDAVNDTAALAVTFATNYHVNFSAGDYRTSEVIRVKKGTKITGAGGGRFTEDPFRTTYIRSLSGGKILLDQSTSTFNGQEDGFSVQDCYLVSDFCIRQNDPLVAITDGGPSPYLMRPTITGCTFQALTAGVGTGVSLSKVFNAVVTENEFRQFDIQLLLLGCDLCDVHNNRFSSNYSYGILELSTATFGSQTTIHHNDMIYGAKTTSIFIKSTGRHVRIIDNYMEQGTDQPQIKGFVDVSRLDVPVYGPNTTSSTAFSSVVVDINRIDGFAKVTDWVYRIEPSGNYTKVNDVNTSGPSPVEPARVLTIVGGYLPIGIALTGATLCHYDITVPLQQSVSMTRFQVVPIEAAKGVVTIRSNNILSLNQSSLKRNNMHRESLLAQNSIVLLPTLLDYLHLILPPVDGQTNVWLASGTTYRVTVVARSSTPSQALEVLPIAGITGSGAPGNFTLTTQYQQYTLNLAGQDINTFCGVALRRPAGAGGNIHIQSISFEKL